MTGQVLCEVKNCQYWEHGNSCGAEQIYVVSQTGDTTYTSSETGCKTFIPNDELS
ncbi:DUF1540 domain-containing protein [Bacillus sp. 1NLA3E]|uniref:DUF1540 domain-containing protein n=1 Tax=Bacillus sp. 1NLA3E TaxID=666686 RepID=UPI00032803B1|nr:DUF1540 domain-containing protein [Bacillus sp. 1NLA3E]AGK55309.1 hypothetical protein B1NLA3E_17825 [Bacillus sp. 1NLA3E]